MYNTWTKTGLLHTKQIVPDIRTPKINYIGDVGMCKFKVGDKVRCVKCFPTQYIQLGEVYTVAKVKGDGIELEEIKLPHAYLDVRFELVQEDAVLTPEEVFEHLRKGTKLQRRQLNEQVWWEDNGNPSYRFIVGMQWRIKPEPEVIELNGKKYREITE